MYDDICACSELWIVALRKPRKAEQSRDSHFSAFIMHVTSTNLSTIGLIVGIYSAN